MLEHATWPRVVPEEPRPILFRREGKPNGFPVVRDRRHTGDAIERHAADMENLCLRENPGRPVLLPDLIFKAVIWGQTNRHRVRLQRDDLVDKAARPRDEPRIRIAA